MFSRTIGSISTEFGTNQPWVKGIQVCSNENIAFWKKEPMLDLKLRQPTSKHLYHCNDCRNVRLRFLRYHLEHPWLSLFIVDCLVKTISLVLIYRRKNYSQVRTVSELGYCDFSIPWLLESRESLSIYCYIKTIIIWIVFKVFNHFEQRILQYRTEGWTNTLKQFECIIRRCHCWGIYWRSLSKYNWIILIKSFMFNCSLF